MTASDTAGDDGTRASPELVAAARQVGGLGGVARQLDGPVVCRARLPAPTQPAQQLGGYHAYHATRADLLRRLGRSEQAQAAYDAAIALAGNTAETAYLTRRRDQLGQTT